MDKFAGKVKDMQKSPKKVYLIDTGMINSIFNGISKNIGLRTENVVFIELMRIYPAA